MGSGGEVTSFGADYSIPRPLAPRLVAVRAPCGAEAAMESGVAVRPIADMRAYIEKLGQFIHRTGLMMKPVYERARADIQRVVYAEGEEENVLRAVQTVVDEQLARPILIGRPEVRSEEHTSELQSLMRISYAVFCLKKKKHQYKAQT